MSYFCQCWLVGKYRLICEAATRSRGTSVSERWSGACLASSLAAAGRCWWIIKRVWKAPDLVSPIKLTTLRKRRRVEAGTDRLKWHRGPRGSVPQAGFWGVQATSCTLQGMSPLFARSVLEKLCPFRNRNLWVFFKKPLFLSGWS